MQINIYNSVDQAILATGITIVIDVFRAFSTEAFAFHNGAEYIIPVLTLEEAYELKAQNPEYILMGERHGLKPEGFDYGNSPTDILNVDFKGKVIVHTTANGTKGLVQAVNAQEIITGAFVNARAIIKYIKSNNFETLSLVSTSSIADNEDLYLANYLKDILEGKEPNGEQIKNIIRNSSTAAFLLQEAGVPDTDIDLCLDFNRFDFIIKQEMMNGRKVLVKKNI